MKQKIAVIFLCLMLSAGFCACQKGTQAVTSTAPAATTAVTTAAESTAAYNPTVSLGVTKAFVIDESNYAQHRIPETYKDKCFGIYISDATTKSDLLRAGFRRGDILRAIGGEDIRSLEDVKRVLCDYQVGDSAAVSVFRYDLLTQEAGEYEITVTFTDPNAPVSAAAAESVTEGTSV